MSEITITKEEYKRLLVAKATLDLLKQGGVDNWTWYSESLYPEYEKSIDEFEIEITKKVNRMAAKP